MGLKANNSNASGWFFYSQSFCLSTIVTFVRTLSSRQHPALAWRNPQRLLLLTALFQQSFMRPFWPHFLLWKVQFAEETPSVFIISPPRLVKTAPVTEGSTPWENDKPLVWALKVFHQQGFKQIVFACHHSVFLYSNSQGNHCSLQM